jgi:hypothetical protein
VRSTSSVVFSRSSRVSTTVAPVRAVESASTVAPWPTQDERVGRDAEAEARQVARVGRAEDRDEQVRALAHAPAREGLAEVLRVPAHAQARAGDVEDAADAEVELTTKRPSVSPARRGSPGARRSRGCTGVRRFASTLRTPVRTGRGTTAR